MHSVSSRLRLLEIKVQMVWKMHRQNWLTIVKCVYELLETILNYGTL